MGDGPGAGLSGQTCCHVGTGTTTRGFAAICLHPEAGRVVTEARRIVRTPCASPAVRPSGRRRLSEGGRARSSPSRSRRTSTWAPSIAPVAERRRWAPTPMGRWRRTGCRGSVRRSVVSRRATCSASRFPTRRRWDDDRRPEWSEPHLLRRRSSARCCSPSDSGRGRRGGPHLACL